MTRPIRSTAVIIEDDARLDALEASDTALDGRLDALEANHSVGYVKLPSAPAGGFIGSFIAGDYQHIRFGAGFSISGSGGIFTLTMPTAPSAGIRGAAASGDYEHLLLGTGFTITGSAGARTLNFSGGGGSSALTDGDYGDIIVSGSGTALMLDSGVVTTFAKTFLNQTTATGVLTVLGADTRYVLSSAADERSVDAVAAALVPGSGMGIVYNDAANTITFTSSPVAPSNTTIWNIIKTMIQAGPNITVDINDSTQKITISSVQSLIAAEDATTASFAEIVRIGLDSCYTDTAGTNPCTGIGQSVACVRDVNGTIAWTQPTSGARPTIEIDAQSGNYGLMFDGADDFMFRAYKGDVQTVRIEYALDYAGKRARPSAQGLLSYPSPISGSTNRAGYDLKASTIASYGADAITWGRYRSNATNPTAKVPMVVGHRDSLLMISDGTNYALYRAGRQAVAASVTATGTPFTLDATHDATVACTSLSNGTKTDFFKGMIFACATAPTALGASEVAGVSQWGVNRIAQKQTLTGWLGVFFSGDASPSERAASHAPTMKHFDAALTRSEYRPSNVPIDTSPALNGFADFGLATNGTDYFLTMDAWGVGTGDRMPIFKFDGFNWVTLSSIAGPSGGGGIGAPTFARNVDNTIYTDGSGRAYIFCNIGGSQGIRYIQSTDSTWATGGTWGTPTLVPGFSSGLDQIDASVMRDASGVWHMAFADYSAGTTSGGGQIRHASCPAGLPTQTWTIGSTVDFYGLGSGYEAPQFLNLGTAGSPSFAMMVDRDGCGMSLLTMPSGLASAPGTMTAIASDDIMEHGEVAPLIAGYANPCLQSKVAPRQNRWSGKGLLVSGNFRVATLRSLGWQYTGFTGGTSPGTWTPSGPVSDPNGDLTAASLSYSGGGSGSFNVAMCDLIESAGVSNGFTGRNTYGIWMRGHVGGEQVILGSANAAYSTFAYGSTITLTTSWAYYEVNLYTPFGAYSALLQGATTAAIAFDACWPNFR